MTGQDGTDRWTPEVAEVIADALDRVRRAAAAGEEPAVVFDLDNTIVRGDTGSLFYLENALNLRLAHDDPGFRAVVDLLGDGDAVCDLIGRAKAGEAAPEDVRDAMIRLYHRVYAVGGAGLAYPWGTQVLAGLREENVRADAYALAESDGARDFSPVWFETGEDGGRSVYGYGIRPYPEMVRLLADFADAGAAVHVVTGTAAIVAGEYVRYWALPVLKVHGMTTEILNGRVTARLVHPVTVGGSKLDVVRVRIGRRPLFVAGDSVSDLSMMLYADGPSLVMGEEDAELVALAREKGWAVQPHFDGPMPKPL